MKNGAAAGLFSPTKTTMGNGKQPKNVYKSLQPQKIPTSFTKAAAKALELIDMEWWVALMQKVLFSHQSPKEYPHQRQKAFA